MNQLEFKLIETAVIIVLYFIVRYVMNWSIRKTWKLKEYAQDRVIIVRRVTGGILFVIFALILSSIWGIDQSEIILFVTSILTVIGIAFFAQWSILSNITSGLILFFHNDVRAGEHLSILDKDLQINGELIEIGIMFTRIKIEDGSIISIPNSVIMQKTISVKR